MGAIDPKWITEFFKDDEDLYGFYSRSDKDNIFIDGHFQPQALAKFLNDKISEHYSILEWDTYADIAYLPKKQRIRAATKSTVFLGKWAGEK